MRRPPSFAIRTTLLALLALGSSVRPARAWLGVTFWDKDGKPIAIMRKFEIRDDKQEFQWLKDNEQAHRRQIESGEAEKAAHFAESPYLNLFWTVTATSRNGVDEAIQLLEKAMKVWPKDDEPYWLMARIYLKYRPDETKAKEWMDKAIALYGQNAERYRKADAYWYALAHRHYCCRSAPLALEHFVKSIESGEEARRMARATEHLYKTARDIPSNVMMRGCAYLSRPALFGNGVPGALATGYAGG